MIYNPEDKENKPFMGEIFQSQLYTLPLQCSSVDH